MVTDEDGLSFKVSLLFVFAMILESHLSLTLVKFKSTRNHFWVDD